MNITEKKFNSLTYIGEGTEGIVRKYSDDVGLKMMYEEEFDDNKKKSINVQCKIEDSNFIFPVDKLYIDRKYRGYTQKMLNGKKPTIKDLNRLKHDVVLIKELEECIKDLTTHHLLIRDLEPRNSIFCNDKLYIIDTSRYILEKDMSYILLERNNKRMLNYFLLNTLIDATDLSIYDLNKIIKKMSLKIQSFYGNIYEDVNCYFNNPQDFSKFLKVLIDDLKIDTLEEFHQKILKLK